MTAYPDEDPNSIFMVAATDLLPDWIVGIVAARAWPETQRRWTTLVIAIFLVAAAVLTSRAQP